MDKTHFKFADLDKVPFLYAPEITVNLLVVLYDSPILYSYMMMIHLTRIHHSGVDITIKAVSNKMFCPGETRFSSEKDQDGLLQVQDHIEENFRIKNG